MKPVDKLSNQQKVVDQRQQITDDHRQQRLLHERSDEYQEGKAAEIDSSPYGLNDEVVGEARVSDRGPEGQLRIQKVSQRDRGQPGADPAHDQPLVAFGKAEPIDQQAHHPQIEQKPCETHEQKTTQLAL